ncbi:MAG TPA: hypothetical protein VNG93_06135 [Candidatus Dormibacteraeota bacterium]|nr:hypothetical protein [Candidatus Dormibacteraeota bacterium]
MNGILWMIVIAIAVILLVAIIVRGISSRRSRPAFEVRGLPASYVGAYQARMTELQAMFVDHPREAVAGAKQLVDDMTMRMGYPTRMTDGERLSDMASVDNGHADRYKVGLGLKAESTTEEMRRALQSYLDLARDLLSRGGADSAVEERGRPEIAG